MTTLGRIFETIVVILGGLIAYVYCLFRYTADVFLTTGAQVVDIWRK